MRIINNCLAIISALFLFASCDWYSHPLELVYPGTDINGGGNNDNADRNRVLNNFENILDYVQERGWKITSGNTDLYYVFDIYSGTFQTKSNINPATRQGSYKLSVSDDLKVEIIIEDNDLTQLFSSNTFVVMDAKITEITYMIKGTETVVKMIPAAKGEIDNVLTVEDKLLKNFTDILYSAKGGAGWKMTLGDETAYFTLDSGTLSYMVKYQSDRTTVKGTYELKVVDEVVYLVLKGSGLDSKVGTEEIILATVNEDGTIAAVAGSAQCTISKATKDEIAAIRSDVEELLNKMLEKGWGSKLVRASNGNFLAHYYVDYENIAVNFTIYDGSTVSKISPSLSASANTLSFSQSVSVSGASLTSFTVGEEVTLNGLQNGMVTTDNLSYARDGEKYSMLEYLSTSYSPGERNFQYQFKNYPVKVSASLQSELEKAYDYGNGVRVYEWNGDYTSFVVFTDNYYFLKYQGTNMNALAGTDIIRFNKNAGLMDLGWTGTDMDHYLGQMGNTYSFFFDQDHIIVRYEDRPDGGLLIMSTSTGDFIHWPVAVE